MDTRDTRSCVEINDEIPSPSWTRSGVRKNAQSREESLNKKKKEKERKRRGKGSSFVSNIKESRKFFSLISKRVRNASRKVS